VISEYVLADLGHASAAAAHALVCADGHKRRYALAHLSQEDVKELTKTLHALPVVVGSRKHVAALERILALEHDIPKRNIIVLDEYADLMSPTGGDKPRSLAKPSARVEAEWDALSAWADALPLPFLSFVCALVEDIAPGAYPLLELTLASRADFLEAGAARFDLIDSLVPHPDPGKRGHVRAPEPDVIERLFKNEGVMRRAFADYEYREQQEEMARVVGETQASSRHLLIEAGTGIGKSLAYLVPSVVLAIRENTPVVVSTHTINLQEQLIGQDIPILRSILPDLEFECTLLKGRAHYVCLKRVLDEIVHRTTELRMYLRELIRESADGLAMGAGRVRRAREPKAAPDNLHTLLKLLFWLMTTKTGDMDEIGLGTEKAGRFLSNFDCSYNTCLGERCPQRAECFFNISRDAAKRSHIVVLNNALLFTLLRAPEETPTVISTARHFVLDEAHNLEDDITNQYTASFSSAWLLGLVNSMLRWMGRREVEHALTGAAGDEARERAKMAMMKIDEVKSLSLRLMDVKASLDEVMRNAARSRGVSNSFDTLVSFTFPSDEHRDIVRALLPKLSQLHHAWLPIAQAFNYLVETMTLDQSPISIDDDLFVMDTKRVAMDSGDLSFCLDSFEGEGENTIRWLRIGSSPEGPTWEFYVCPMSVGDIFRGFLDRASSVVMTSATMTVGGTFDFVKSRLGLLGDDGGSADRLDSARLTTPFPMAKNALVLVPTDVSEPTYARKEPYLAQMKSLVVSIADTFKGGVLFLFNSYADMNAVADLTAADLDARFPVFVQGRSGSRTHISRRFRDERDSILFGTRSFFEGFDVVGESLRCVVLAKLPFANFKEPVHDARLKYIDETGGSSFAEYSLPLAVMKFKQGFGRLIRTKTDYGCVFVLDSRLTTRGYGRLFIESLPGPGVASGAFERMIADARTFMDRHAGADGRKDAKQGAK